MAAEALRPVRETRCHGRQRLPVATPGTHSRRTGRKPEYVRYEPSGEDGPPTARATPVGETGGWDTGG